MQDAESARWSVTGTDADVWESYTRKGHKIGAGGFGFVFGATHKGTGEMVAIKAVPKLDLKRAPQTAPEQLGQMRRRDAQRLREEILIMRKLDHPNTVLLYETFEDDKNVFLVMELCSGGELLGFILESGRHTETQSVIVMKQVFQAVAYLHSAGICHRDIKHSNTLMLTQAQLEDNVVKLVDFGLACCFTRGEPMRQCAGTAIYVAPQVLECKYDHSIDLWSCGVLLYILLCGYPPFRGDTDAAIMNAIRRGNYSFPSSDWSLVSQDAKSLIRQLLKLKTKERITAEGGLKHAWIQEPRKEPVQLQKALERMRKFVAYHRQTQNLNPEQLPADPDPPGIERSASQASIATRIPQTLPSAGAWLKDLQKQFSAFTNAVGSAISSKPEKKRVVEEISSLPQQNKPSRGYDGSESPSRAAKEPTPSQVFREKHVLEDDEPIIPAKTSQPWPGQVMEKVLDLDALLKNELQQEVLSERKAPPDISVGQARSMPGQALMNLSSTAKPMCPFDDILPPESPQLVAPPDLDPAVEENAGDADSTARAYVGQQMEFWSKTASRWIPCEVINVRSDTAIMVNVKPNTWLTAEDQARRLRASQAQRSPDISPTPDPHKVRLSIGRTKSDDGQFSVGQPVEYLSISAGRWIPSRVIDIDEENSIQLDVKPGCWIPLHHQKGHVRLPGLLGLGEANAEEKLGKPSGGPADLDLSNLQGVELEYYCLNLSAWIPCRILQQDDQSGCVVLDVLPSAWITPAQQATYLRAASGQENLRIPLIGDKVVYFSESHMRWILTIITDVGDADEVELEIKPGVWIRRDMQKRVLRWCADQL